MPSEPGSGRPAGTPYLSVVMPVHDGSEWIRATLDSMAGEPVDGLEILVIDSSPTRTTADIVEGYADRLPLRVIHRPDLGCWRTKTNYGVTVAAADHFCMLHQDDLWLAGRVDAVRRWIASVPGAAMHLAPTSIIDRSGRHLGSWTCPLPPGKLLDEQFLIERLLVQNFVCYLAPVIQRSAWSACGGLDETLWYTADWDMWMKLASIGPAVYHDETTTGFRIHGSSLTVTGSRDAAEFRSQMETVLDRHLHRLPASSRRQVESAARTSININVSLAAASAGSFKSLVRAAVDMLSLGPVGMARYLRDSRLGERALPRLRAKLTGTM